MPSLQIATLLETPVVRVMEVRMPKAAGRAMLELEHGPCFIFPYKGIHVIDVDGERLVADASQMILVDGMQTYAIERPYPTASAALILHVENGLLREILPDSLLRAEAASGFSESRLRIDARAQALVAVVRHSLTQGTASVMEGETLALTLLQRSVTPRTTHAAGATTGRRRLVDRAKLVLLDDPGRAWSLAEIASRVGVSPVYLTQSFAAVEGLPLYKYQTHIRLARALDLIADYDDLAQLALDLGFSSHSHFTTVFRQMYGKTPSEFRNAVLRH